MSDRCGRSNLDRFPKRKDAKGRILCRVCGTPVFDGRRTFCGPRCLRDFFMRTDWKRVRRVVYARDGGTCMKCGCHVRAADFHVDHIVPVALGGDEWDLANLELSCRECNLQKGAREEIEYVVLDGQANG
jgi:5-methylcytosine-specific restriction endonuclease McrA